MTFFQRKQQKRSIRHPKPKNQESIINRKEMAYLNFSPLHKPIIPNKLGIIISPLIRSTRNLDTESLAPRRDTGHSLELALDLLNCPGRRNTPLSQESGL
jgi:hypothetical protein